VIRSALSYARCFTLCLGRADERRLILSHRAGSAHNEATDRTHVLRNAIKWLMRAQDQGRDGGVGSYHLVEGWGAPYPETTGYIIPTLLAASAHLQWPEPKERAMRAADWLVSIQRSDGGWQGGRIDDNRPSIVFNSAQVIRGLLAIHAATKEDKYLRSAVRCADWIVSVQEGDGTWAHHNFLGTARVYDSYVDAPLLYLYALTNDERYREAAERNLAWVLAQQQANGWFRNADNTIKHNDRPITHTIAYTIDGLIESSQLLKRADLLLTAQRAADALLDRFLRDGALHGRYDAAWKGCEHMITTGCAQLAICWARLHAITGEARYAEGTSRMTVLLEGVQRRSALGPADVHGAMPGSFPLWGRYEKFAFPNWATKYFSDALLCADGVLPAY
jgi:uncharacterized protein YyaL (SSP411 family)